MSSFAWADALIAQPSILAPDSVIDPDRPEMMCSSVDFPQPGGPTRQRIRLG